MPKKILEDARICLSLLTRIPLPASKGEESAYPYNLERIGKAYRAAPLVGLVTGLAGAAGFALGWAMPGQPLYTAAVLAVAAQLMISGGSQEIGFAKMLSLGKHPSADTEGHDVYAGVAAGAISVGVILLLKMNLIALLTTPWQAGLGLIAASAVGRAAQVQLMALTSDDADTQPSKVDATTSMIFGVGIGVVALFIAFGKQAFGPLLGAFLGVGISTLLFFSTTNGRHHLDNVNVKEALGWAVEIGALFGIAYFAPPLG